MDRPVLSRLLGLRPRLVVAFALVALFSGAAVAAASYRQARTIVLEKTQDQVADRTRNSLEELDPPPQLPPDQQELERIGDAINGLAVYGDRRSSFQPVPLDRVPPQLRRAVRERGRVVVQRIVLDGQPYVLAGTEVQDIRGQRTGIEVYAVQKLTSEQETIDRLARSAAIILALALLPAVLLALGAAAGVLRPVRDLRRAARRLAEGRLDTRLRVRGSDELSELVRTFNTMAGKLQHNVGELRRMEANGRRFVADVSHELRTPLTAMTAVTDALEEEAASLGGDAAIAARIMSTETRRLRQLVENLIEISRFDAGGAVLRPERVDLAAVVSATLTARGWTGIVHTDLPTGIVAELDRRRLDVIVANLVGNALKHGAPPVTVELRAVDRDHVVVTVTDRGPGLAPEILPHVFERFYKADSARARSDGSGLGLAIAWENARLHGGVLEAGNAAGKGARFTLRLPRHPTASAAATAADRAGTGAPL
ncbi:HAMP domain-containing histidine kinase [Planosporangium thailandense]|uniref:histidine kinase n=1 Tax=Planosporangium thailandense TaxID=765197 RepID=A0ABX0Y3G3_9ACTN|nr:HAMP domain-containing histidine kinase [Planosporangium thailandense]